MRSRLPASGSGRLAALRVKRMGEGGQVGHAVAVRGVRQPGSHVFRQRPPADSDCRS